MFVGVLFAAVFALTCVVIAVSIFFLQGQILPVIADPESYRALMRAITMMSAGSFVVSALMLSALFYLVGKYVALPLQRMTVVIEEFAQTQERQQSLELGWVPAEVRSLARSFDSLTERVSEVHAHDVEVSRMKSDFISTAAHQLRTPLTGIRWALEALQMEPLPENQKALVAGALEKNRQLVATVGTLLDITSIESGKHTYDMKRTPLDALVDKVVRDFALQAEKANISLLFRKSGMGTAIVTVDRERIRWVLNNLVENAIRYTPAGGSVLVTTEAVGNLAYVRVRDTGIGIPESDRANIFQRFYRAQNAVSKENAGNGLGLYIARTVATDHGGDLNFAPNENGVGTTFTLSLPIASEQA